MSREDDLRIRLEGGAELLDATRLRYRALVPALDAFFWKDRLRRVSEVVRETARVQARVDEVLTLVQRRAEAEEWPEGPVLATAREVRDLRTKLRELATHRLGDDASYNLEHDLLELELRASSSPRLVLPGQRWATACEVLPPTLDELKHARTFAPLVEAAFGPPGEVTVARWLPAEAAWGPSTAALDQAWRRVERIDVTGGLARSLRRRARRLPHFSPEHAEQGPAALITAEYWRGLALARIEHRVTSAVAPVLTQPTERWSLFGWLIRRDADFALSLPATGFTPTRAALLELAVLLSSGGAGPAARPLRQAQDRPFERLRSLAHVADQNPHDEDWRRLRDAIALVVRVAATPARWLPPVHRTPGSEPEHPDLSGGLENLLRTLESHLTQNKH